MHSKNYFKVIFPLVHNFNKQCSIIFNKTTTDDKNEICFYPGLNYITGENGAGKSTFLHILALLTGRIGSRELQKQGKIIYNGQSYDDKSFTVFKAAKIREEHFCIFSQQVFFLPGINSIQNFELFNPGYQGNIIDEYEDPYLLSGGQQQMNFLNMIMQDHKNVWFLDEPLNNLDTERQIYFWEILKNICTKTMPIIFLIDHNMEKEKSLITRFFDDSHNIPVLFQKAAQAHRTETAMKIFRCCEKEKLIGFIDKLVRSLKLMSQKDE
jgi:ABC-type multidrug transport system ATPase subunit